MRTRIILLLILSVTSLLSYSQYYDTIVVGKGVTTLIEFKGDATIRQLDISGSATSNIAQVKTKDLYYAVMDSTASILKFKAVRPFTGKIIMTVFSDTTVQYMIKYEEDPAKTYYAYNLESKTSGKRSKTTISNVPQKSTEEHFQDLAGGTGGDGELTDLRTDMEKNSGELINPKNKLFTAMRSKNQNITAGDIKGGVRIYLQKLYKSRQLTYFMFKISNFSMADFQLDDFSINKVEAGSDVKLTEIHEESAYNLLKRYEQVDFIVIAENVEINASGKLVFTFKGKGDKGGSFLFEVDSKAFSKRELL